MIYKSSFWLEMSSLELKSQQTPYLETSSRKCPRWVTESWLPCHYVSHTISIIISIFKYHVKFTFPANQQRQLYAHDLFHQQFAEKSVRPADLHCHIFAPRAIFCVQFIKQSVAILPNMAAPFIYLIQFSSWNADIFLHEAVVAPIIHTSRGNELKYIHER